MRHYLVILNFAGHGEADTLYQCHLRDAAAVEGIARVTVPTLVASLHRQYPGKTERAGVYFIFHLYSFYNSKV